MAYIDHAMALSEPGGGPPVYPQADKAITNGWRRVTPESYNNPFQTGTEEGGIDPRLTAAYSGVELS